jgi:hypothetical protein
MLGLSFSRIQGDAAAYIAARLRAAAIDADPGLFLDDDLVSSLVLADLSQMAFTAAVQIEISVRERCAVQTVEQSLPLLDGETVQEDYFTCLEQPVEELARGTAVLRRTTNMGVTWVFFPDFRLTAENELEYTGLPDALLEAASSEAQEPRPEVLPRGLVIAGMAIESIALSLAQALLKGLGGKVGALAWNQLFQGGVPSYFGEVYQEIRRIVSEELTRHDMDLITARLNAVVEWQRLVYEPKNPRAQTAERERRRLFEEVESQLEKVRETTSILRHDRWRKAGMGTFMGAGSLYFALCQEACMVDPAVSPSRPEDSSYAKTIQLTAAEYAGDLERTYKELLQARIEAVTITTFRHILKIGRKSYMATGYQWSDPVKGTTGPRRMKRKTGRKTVEGDPRAEATADLENYRRGLPPLFHKDMRHPLDVVATWQQLVKQPLPEVSTLPIPG